MNGYTYEVTWYNLSEGSNKAFSFDLKKEALTFARDLKERSIYHRNVKVFRIKYGSRTQVWGEMT